MLLPAGLTRCWFTGLHEQIFDELRGLHLVEHFDANTEEHLGQIFRYLLRDALVLVDDAKDESLLAVRAVPGITDRTGLLVLSVAVLTTVAIELVGAAVLLLMLTGPVVLRTAIGFRNKTGVLDFLIDALLQKSVELLNFGFDLCDVREFDFDGCRKTVTAELRESELLAVVGAEFDGHGV